MTMDSIIASSNDSFTALLAGLGCEFGSAGIEGLARHFLDAEAADFHWEARIAERYLGTFEALESDDAEWVRVAVIGRLAGRWYAAVMIVDGDGAVDRMQRVCEFESAPEVRSAYLEAR
uniref:hypothetical protein n=1 Tax=uncultured Sphingomonas sp. TaxID=158754 RepID=UPI0035C9AB22